MHAVASTPLDHSRSADSLFRMAKGVLFCGYYRANFIEHLHTINSFFLLLFLLFHCHSHFHTFTSSSSHCQHLLINQPHPHPHPHAESTQTPVHIYTNYSTTLPHPHVRHPKRQIRKCSPNHTCCPSFIRFSIHQAILLLHPCSSTSRFFSSYSCMPNTCFNTTISSVSLLSFFDTLQDNKQHDIQRICHHDLVSVFNFDSGNSDHCRYNHLIAVNI